MKVIFLLPNLSSGGAERVVSILSSSMIDKGYNVDIALLVDGLIQYEIDRRVNIVLLNTIDMSKKRRIKTLRSYLKTQKKQDRIVLIPFQDSCLKNALLASLGIGVPVIACERNNPYRKGESFGAKIKASIPYIFAKACVFQTNDARKYYSMLRDKKCAVIPNPIKQTSYKWTFNENPAQMIAVGRLHKQKNYHMLIDAMALVKSQIPNARVHVYGEGSLLDELNSYAAQNDVSEAVVFHGSVNNVAEKLAQSSVFIMTSDYEGISNAMLEAMSVGMPIVCTDCPIGGARMMLGSGAGILSPVGDSKKFAENLLDLLNNKEMMISLGEKAHRKTEDYSIEATTKMWIDVVKNKCEV